MRSLIYFCLLFYPLFTFAQETDVVSLSGTWRFALDSADAGERDQWFGNKLPDTIELPGITDEGGYGPEVIETGKLSRLHKYIGKAWYQMDIIVPEEWKDRNIQVSLERVMWRSKLWLDRSYIGLQESLSTPHSYFLGKLSPGTHTLTLSIDNREIYPIGNTWGHSYGEQTQTIWNGVVGEMRLSAHPDVAFGQVRTFPDQTGRLDVEVSVQNYSRKKQKAALHISVKEKKTGQIAQTGTFPVQIEEGQSIVKQSLMVSDPDLWDEFSPNLYSLECSLKSKSGKDVYKPIYFGFRTIGRTSDYITVNGLPRYLRGNLDCALFPQTGYPATDKESWLRILNLYKEHGLNHIRFHSWTPPAAAFEAADEVGVYVLSEIFWRDGWMGKNLNVDSVAPFLRPELRRIADEYGNHSSLIMLAMGNELGGFDRNKMDPWIEEVKAHDPRHFYAVSVRRPATEHADINYQGDLSSPYPLLFIDEGRLSTDWDYAEWYGKASPLPSIQHEVGQWTFYPSWKETDKYTGTLRARGLEKYKQLARERGVYAQNDEFIESSGLQSLTLYKENIESLLRTPLCGGFQLLGMQDFSGQGEALIGWLDAFYDSKGVVTPERFRNWCNTTVPLMRTPSYIYSDKDTLRAEIEVLHFSTGDLRQASIHWILRGEAGTVMQSGSFGCDIENALLNKIGQIQVPLSGVERPMKLSLEVSVAGTEFKNDWNFWIFPESTKRTLSGDVIETNSLQEAIDGLKKGKVVFLWAYGLGYDKNAGYALWKPTFWQGGNLGNEGFTNGAVVRKKHPALAAFPTDHYLDFQWYDICKGGRGFELEGLPFSIRPIVQPIHDFHFNRKLASILEFSSKEGGKILICGYNLVDSIENRPAALALRNSLMDYVASDAFLPVDTLNFDWMKEQLQNPDAPYLAPTVFENACLYVKAGGRCQKIGTTDWNNDRDAVTFFETDKYGYNVACEHIYTSESFSAWQGKEIQLDLKLPFQYKGTVKLYLCNPDGKERKGIILFNGKEITFDIPQEGKWISLQMNAGEALLGKISVALKSTSGNDLLVGEMAVMPQ